jgi:hypothetical protein
MTNDIGEIQKMSLTFWAEDEHDNWACKEVYIKNEMTNKAWIFLVIRGFDSWSYLNPPIFQATQWDPNNIPSPT